ncbi:hypothetical protein D7X12_18145 [Corallococcus sicarius]|uniref:Trypsin-co-occurring domain-containing protein n=2 Tax=Corallococcus sicarius TaxID=2316726 RepID=A0A3A8NPV3_9BACT|nr:hypothetical protein D7X12_18145 [Corallococcus sicarius]
MGIPLAQMIQDLRQELEKSQRASDDERLRFKVEGVELELQVAVSRESQDEGGIKFYVLSLGSKYRQEHKDVHSFKFKLLPVSGPERDHVYVNDKEKVRPR